MSDDSRDLIVAMNLWTGRGGEMMPSRHDSRVLTHFGHERGERWLEILRELEKDFYASNATLSGASLQQMGEIASGEFKRRHPEVPKDVVEALAWCFTFDNR